MKNFAMKKIPAMLMIVCLTFLLAGCNGGSSVDEEAVTTAVDGFFGALVEGKFADAKEFCTEDFQDAADLEEMRNLEKVFLESMNLKKSDLDDTAKKKLEETSRSIKQKFISSYEITNIAGDETSVTVEVNVTYGFNPDELENIDVADQVDKVTKAYIKEHQEELTEIYVENGEDAMKRQYLNGVFPDMMDIYEEAITTTGESSQVLVVTLMQQEDGSWLITEITAEADEEVAESDEDADEESGADSADPEEAADNSSSGSADSSTKSESNPNSSDDATIDDDDEEDEMNVE